MSERADNLKTQLEQCFTALQSSEARFRNIIARSADGILVVDGSGVIRFANPAAESLFGRKADELTGEVFGFPVVAGETSELTIVSRRDTQTIIDMRVVETEWGEERAFLANLRDITDRKQMEADIRRLNAELGRSNKELQQAKEHLEKRVEERTADLESALNRLREETKERLQAMEELRRNDQLLIQQSRMAAMGEMIGFIAHQWRQPLNNLGLIVQDLSMSYSRGAFTQEYLDTNTARAMQVIMQMSLTIDDFRNFLKTEKEKVPFRVNDVLKKTTQLVDSSFRDINLSIDVSGEDDVIAEGYPNEYSQVILNILLNARDVSLERKVEQPRIVIRVFKDKNKAVMTIADNGGGIPEEILSRIFDPYFTTKGPDRGTGVGLYMAKTIIEKNMGGTLRVRNTEEGAEFRIEL